MRKEPEAVRQWSQSLIDSCASVQRQLVTALWRALKPGGVLLYSTCTFNRTENELNVASFVDGLGAESIDLGLDAYDGVGTGIDTPHRCYRFTPGHVRGEGLFIAALRKPGSHSAGGSFAVGRRRQAAKLSQEASVFVAAHVLGRGDGYSVAEDGVGIILRPSAHDAFVGMLSSKVRMLRSGFYVAVMKGRDYVPTHELALSTMLDTGSFAAVDLDYRAAMSYLRGEAMAEVPPTLAKGFALACYGGRPLGFLKNVGRRANNLYPEAMRLRLEDRQLPSEPPQTLIETK